jgi:O-antigen/teichoic acid export membrane protein
MSLIDQFHRFKKVFFSTFINQCLIFSIQFISSMLVVRSLEIHDYATYILFNTTMNLASSLANLGLRAYMTVFVPGAEREKARKILWACLVGQFAANIILILAFAPVLAHPSWGWLEKFQVEGLPFLYACFSAILLISFVPRQFAGVIRYLDEDHKRANRLQVISGTAVPIFLIGSWAVLGKLSLAYVLFGMGLVQIFSIAIIVMMCKDLAGFPGMREVGGEVKSALAYSWPFALLPVATQLIELGNRYFLAGYGTPVDLAQFSFNYGICAAAFQLINTSMGFAFFPKAFRMFNKGQRKEAERFNLKGVLISTVLVVLCFAAFWIISPVFFRVLGREALRLPALPFALICVSFIAQVLSQHGNFILQAYNLRISNVGITITGTVISLALNYLLIPRYRAMGAALALAITAVILLLLNLLPGLLRKPAAAVP